MTFICCFYLLYQLIALKSPEDAIPISHEQQISVKNINSHYQKSNKSGKIAINGPNVVKTTKYYPTYYEDSLRPDWPFKISRTYDPELLYHWSEPNCTLCKSDFSTRGENGSPFMPIDDDEYEEIKSMYEKFNYNFYASERISLHRSLPDIRFKKCHQIKYRERLPKVSIIIVYHNEAWSLVLRTIWSIINRSPRELLHEIILVDDVSTWDFLKRPLEDYIELLPVNIRIIRTKQREGLIRARLVGAKSATVNINNHSLTFLLLENLQI